MQIPLTSDIDIEALEPVMVKAVLHLPSVSHRDVRAATHSFSSALARFGDCDAHREPKLFAELLMRYLLVVSYELLENPAEVLSVFNGGRFHPWFERRCEVLVPSDRGAFDNLQTLVDFLSSWCSDTAYWEVLGTSATLIAIGSLSNFGRLPLHKAPERTRMG